MATVRRVNTGDPITAAWANELADAVRDQAGGLLGGDLGKNVLALAALLQDPDRFVAVKIKAVRLTGAGIDDAYFPSAVRYQVEGIRRPGILEDNLVPFYGREVEDDEARVYPAKVGMTAFLERDVVEEGPGDIRVIARLMLLPGAERVARKRCGG